MSKIDFIRRCSSTARSSNGKPYAARRTCLFAFTRCIWMEKGKQTAWSRRNRGTRVAKRELFTCQVCKPIARWWQRKQGLSRLRRHSTRLAFSTSPDSMITFFDCYSPSKTYAVRSFLEKIIRTRTNISCSRRRRRLRALKFSIRCRMPKPTEVVRHTPRVQLAESIRRTPCGALFNSQATRRQNNRFDLASRYRQSMRHKNHYEEKPITKAHISCAFERLKEVFPARPLNFSARMHSCRSDGTRSASSDVYQHKREA